MTTQFLKIPYWSIFVCGLVLLNLAFFTVPFDLTKLQWLQILYQCDPTRWAPYSPVSLALWLCVVMLIVDTIFLRKMKCTPTENLTHLIAFRRKFSICATLLIFAVPIFCFNIHLVIWYHFYYNIYSPVVYVPLIDFFITGKIHWQLGIFIVACIVLMVYLSRLPKKIKTKP